MTTYNSAVYNTSTPAVGHGGSVKSFTVPCTTTAAVTTADTLQLFTLPAYATVTGFEVKATQMDTNGSPTLAWNVGVAGAATTFFAGVTAGRTATPAWQNETATTATHTGVGYYSTAPIMVIAQPSANPATGAAGTFTMNIEYVINGGPSYVGAPAIP